MPGEQSGYLLRLSAGSRQTSVFAGPTEDQHPIPMPGDAAVPGGGGDNIGGQLVHYVVGYGIRVLAALVYCRGRAVPGQRKEIGLDVPRFQGRSGGPTVAPGRIGRPGCSAELIRNITSTFHQGKTARLRIFAIRLGQQHMQGSALMAGAATHRLPSSRRSASACCSNRY